MIREGSFNAVLRNHICLNALKAALNLEEEEWWCLAWLPADTGPLVGLHINPTVYKEILKKHVVLNLRTASDQPAVYMQDNFLCHTAKFVKTFLSEDAVTVTEWPA